MTRYLEGESKNWQELRNKLFGLLDTIHELKEQEKQKEKEKAEKKHVLSIRMSIKIITKKHKKSKNKEGIRIIEK